MYSNQSGLIFGFHGCDASLVEDVLLGKTELKQSNNKYDWLGNGIYFWENSPARAHEWAEHLKNNPGQSKNEIKNPAVLGAVIDIGNCLDFTEYSKIQLLKEGYKTLKELFKVIPDAHLPKNKNVKGNSDLLLRELDCAVIEIIHQTRKDNNDLPFDSV